MTDKVFEPGGKFGHFKLLRRVRPNKKLSANLKVRWRVKCCCGKELTVPQYYMTRKNPKTHCGCRNQSIKTKYNREYRIWLMMHQRCYNPNHDAYHHYGGRGIKIAEEWNRYTPDGEKDLEIPFRRFLRHIRLAPSTKHSVDRIDVDGNYEPGNVRWATAKEQRANQRSKKKVEKPE